VTAAGLVAEPVPEDCSFALELAAAGGAVGMLDFLPSDPKQSVRVRRAKLVARSALCQREPLTTGEVGAIRDSRIVSGAGGT